MSGMSFLPWLRGEEPSAWRDAIFLQLNGVELYYTQRIVMTDTYKYVYNGFDFDELYDLKNDPHEMVNLAYPNVVHAQARVEEGRGLENRGDLPWPPLSPQLDQVRRNLVKQMWRFAQLHQDTIFNPYLTVAMAPYGPAIELSRSIDESLDKSSPLVWARELRPSKPCPNGRRMEAAAPTSFSYVRTSTTDACCSVDLTETSQRLDSLWQPRS